MAHRGPSKRFGGTSNGGTRHGSHTYRRRQRLPGGDCPSVHITDDPNVLVVQGVKLDDATRTELGERLPDHEDAVTIPADVIREAARVLEGRA